MASQFLPFVTGVGVYHYGNDTRRRASVLLQETHDLTRAIVVLNRLAGEGSNGSRSRGLAEMESSLEWEYTTTQSEVSPMHADVGWPAL